MEEQAQGGMTSGGEVPRQPSEVGPGRGHHARMSSDAMWRPNEKDL